MKNTLKTMLLASALLLPAEALAQTYTGKVHGENNGNRMTVESGGEVKLKSGATLTFQAGSAVDGSGPTFSTALTGNPLVQANFTDTTVSTGLTSTAMTTIIASASGKTIYPTDVTIMVSGTAASATALALECSDGTLIASWPIADLVDLKPISTGLYLSTQSTVTTGPGLAKGCGSGNAVMLSNVGTNITTTTHVYTKVGYVKQ